MLRIYRIRPTIMKRLSSMTSAEAARVLGIEQNLSLITQKEVKEHYIQLVKRLHPDISDGDSKSFVRLSEAYECLSNQTDIRSSDEDCSELDAQLKETLKKYFSSQKEQDFAHKYVNDRYVKYRQQQRKKNCPEEEILSEEEYTKKVLHLYSYNRHK